MASFTDLTGTSNSFTDLTGTSYSFSDGTGALTDMDDRGIIVILTDSNVNVFTANELALNDVYPYYLSGIYGPWVDSTGTADNFTDA